MRAELLVVAGCPHTAEAERRYRTALDLSGHGQVTIHVKVLDTLESAAAVGCTRSPTFRLDGVDLLADPYADGDGVACRWTIPTAADLADAIAPRRR